jgi:hypothetical protein
MPTPVRARSVPSRLAQCVSEGGPVTLEWSLMFTYPPGARIGSRCSKVGGLVRDTEAPRAQ